MNPLQHFNVLGIDTEVLVTSELTDRAFSICTFDCRPGDGPPPHRHTLGDEVFMVISGDFEVFDGYRWSPIPKEQFVPLMRGGIHTFRNSGSAVGRLLSVGVSGLHDKFLNEVSSVTLPQEAVRFMEISDRYGISYPRAAENEHSSDTPTSTPAATTAAKHLDILGEDVEIVVSSGTTEGRVMVLTQTSPPGGGVPVHTHLFEDEIFSVMEGEYEFFDGQEWVKYSKGDVWYALRGCAHGFRNCGQSDGKIHAIALPGTGLEGLLEDMSGLKIPEDIEKLMEVSDKYGITFERQ